MRDLVSEIMQTLRHNKLRTALTGISVSWGVFMLIVLLSAARGITNSFEESMLSRNNAVIKVWGGVTSKPYRGNREGRRIRMSQSDLTALPAKHPEYIRSVNSRLYGSSPISTPQATISANYEGVFPDGLKEDGSGDITRGRFITDNDMQRTAKVIVLPEEYARQLFPPDGEKALGGRVNCAGLSFKVVGIYSSRWDRSIYIPFTTARMMAKDKEDLGNLTVNLQNVTTEEEGLEAESQIRSTLAGAHGFHPDDQRAVWIWNRFNDSLKAQGASGILTMSVWILGMLTLLTGVVGISNIMFVSVRERTHEIGIRRAIGAKPRKILTQVITESVAITIIFGYIGIVAGMAVSQLIDYLVADDSIMKNPTVSISIALQVTGVLVVCGAFAGLFPAMKALKIKPVEALRDE